MMRFTELKSDEIKDKSVWEDFLLACEEKTFLNSWNWGEFQLLMGSASGGKIWRFGIFQDNELISLALVVKISARRGTFLFLPHGPLTKHEAGSGNYEILKTLLFGLKKIAKEEGASFIRVSPIWERNEANNEIFKKLGFRTAPIHMHPEMTWELNITPSEEELLLKMRKTTRYLIRQAEKNRDIEIIKSQEAEDVDKFNNLYQETVGRHHFTPFPLNYLKNEFLAFYPDNQPFRQAQGCPECIEGQILIFLARYREEIISSAMIIFWSNIAFYHQGASSLKHSKIPASYLLQWEAIKEAKKRHCQGYNFWGIAPVFAEAKTGNLKSKFHPWHGLTLFKMGFGGYKREYVKTQDLPLSNKYWLTFIFEKLRKAKRGL